MSQQLPHYTLVSTSDRYDLEWEESAIAAVDDLDLTLIPGSPTNEDELIDLAKDADALLISSREAISQRVVDHLPKCRVISRYAVGLDHVDLDAAARAGIVVTHFPDYCTTEVADHALAMILGLNRRLYEFDRDLRAGVWVAETHHMDRILRGPIPAFRDMTIGIVGVGRIGSAVAQRLRAFGPTLLGADPYADPNALIGLGVQPVDLSELLERSDIVTLHCPLTPETRGLIGAAEFERMKTTAFLVNTARGPIVDLDAAVAALESGSIAGAGLDVVYPEPMPMDSPLYRLDNVVLTPHAAYYSERSVETVRHQTLFAAIDVLRGVRPRIVANPAVLERVSLRSAQ